MEEQNNNSDKLRQKFAHIKGWAIDADPKNEPTYPMKNWTGDDHKRLNWDRPPLQEKNVEVLHSTEHLRTPAAFGTTYPPSGLSGVVRRYAFTYSENMLRHWLLLIMADRVNVIEGLVADLKKGKLPNLKKERGFDALWEHNKQLMIRRTAFRVACYGAAIGLVAALLMDDDKEKKTKIAKRKRALSYH